MATTIKNKIRTSLKLLKTFKPYYDQEEGFIPSTLTLAEDHAD